MLVAGYPYLTESTFLALNNSIGERVFIYDPLDYNLSRAFPNYPYPDKIKSVYERCSYTPMWKRFLNLPWLISIFLSSKKWSSSLIADIKSFDPKTIILITDVFPSSKIIERNFPHKNIILLQPCLIDAWEREDKNKIKRDFINFLLKQEFFHTQQYWGLEGKNNKLCLYDQEILDFFNQRRENIFFIDSPMKNYYGDKILRKRIAKEKDQKLTIGIFPVDYSSIYGDKYQEIFNEKYSELCAKLRNEDLYIKVHPHDDEEYWRLRLPEGINIIKEAHKEILYSKTDIHISTYSYSTIEAFYSGSYAVNFQPSNQKMKGNLKKIFENNSSFYSECSDEVIQRISEFKNASETQKNEKIQESLYKSFHSDILSIKELV